MCAREECALTAAVSDGDGGDGGGGGGGVGADFLRPGLIAPVPTPRLEACESPVSSWRPPAAIAVGASP